MQSTIKTKKYIADSKRSISFKSTEVKDVSPSYGRSVQNGEDFAISFQDGVKSYWIQFSKQDAERIVNHWARCAGTEVESILKGSAFR